MQTKINGKRNFFISKNEDGSANKRKTNKSIFYSEANSETDELVENPVNEKILESASFSKA